MGATFGEMFSASSRLMAASSAGVPDSDICISLFHHPVPSRVIWRRLTASSLVSLGQILPQIRPNLATAMRATDTGQNCGSSLKESELPHVSVVIVPFECVEF